MKCVKRLVWKQCMTWKKLQKWTNAVSWPFTMFTGELNEAKSLSSIAWSVKLSSYELRHFPGSEMNLKGLLSTHNREIHMWETLHVFFTKSFAFYTQEGGLECTLNSVTLCPVSLNFGIRDCSAMERCRNKITIKKRRYSPILSWTSLRLTTFAMCWLLVQCS